MKGALLLSEDHDLFAKSEQMLLSAGGISAPGDTVQVSNDEGQLFTLFHDGGDDFRSWPIIPRPGVAAPDLSVITAFSVECRWERYFAAVVASIAQLADGRTWVLDGKDVLWDAKCVNPDEVSL